MMQRGAIDTGKEEKIFTYPVYTRNGYRLVAITDEEERAQLYIRENDNHIRQLFYMKKRIYDPSIVYDMDESFMYCIDHLSDCNGYELDSNRKWCTPNDYEKVVNVVDNTLFEMFKITGDLTNISTLLNLPDEVSKTLQLTANVLHSLESLFIDEDSMENINQVFYYLSYDKIIDQVFDYHPDHVMMPEKFRTRNVRTIF